MSTPAWSYTGQSFTSAQSYAYLGGTSYSYTGAHSYSNTGGNSAAMPLSYSYAGSQSGPILSAGISDSRSDLINGLFAPPFGGVDDVGAAVEWGSTPTNLPPLDVPATMRRWAEPVRVSLVEFELVSHLAFRCPTDVQDGEATLYHLEFATGPAAPNFTSAIPIVKMSRPGRKYFEAQLAKVESHASSRDTRGPEILTQIDPPMAYFASIANLHSERTPKTLALLALAQHFAYIVEMRFKHALACPRAVEYSAAIQPVIQTPAHGSLPSGHATESFMAAGVLGALIPGFGGNGKPQKALRRLAHRIAENRVVAGLHFPIDSIAGRLLGDTLARYFVALCNPQAPWSLGVFNGASLVIDAELTDGTVVDGSEEPNQDDAPFTGPGCYGELITPTKPYTNTLLAEVWQHAAAEWV